MRGTRTSSAEPATEPISGTPVPSEQVPATPVPPTRVKVALTRRLQTLLGVPALAAAIGLVLALGLELVAHLGGFDGVLGYADSFGEPVGLAVGAGVGLLLGGLVAAGLLREAMRAEVGSRSLTVTWDDARVCVPRTLVQRIVLDEDLVVLGRAGVELARVPMRLDRAALRTALARHGYPDPHATDPYDADFRPWSPSEVEDEPTARLLSARAVALKDGQHGDAELLRRQLARRGIMVRDRHGRSPVQEWRKVVAPVQVSAAA